jgi:uncharacterized protein with FMN-binding domain
VRRGVKLTMSAATVVVVGVGLRMSAQPHPNIGVAQPVPAIRPSRAPSPHTPSGTHREAQRKARAGKAPTSRRSVVSGSSTSASLTVVGGVVSTPYGPVQVEVTLRAGRIIHVRAVARPSGNGQTQQINSYAIPQLDQETLAAQSAQIDTVSGATFTSDGYRQSLQSALDAAHRAGER